VKVPARELLEHGVALIIGPDTTDLGVELRGTLDEQTMILPGFATAHADFRRPVWWFVMGAGTARVACELQAQLQHDRRTRPIVLTEPTGYNNLIAWEMVRRYAIPQVVLPLDQASSTSTVQPILRANADAFVLAAQPVTASSLLYAMAALGQLTEPTRWYLSPTLHTPALLATVPSSMLAGASGVAPGTVAGAADFRKAFQARWQDEPLDDAYAYYDAGAIAVLALAHAVARTGAIPPGSGLGPHVLAVTHAGNAPVAWDDLGHGLTLLAQGQEIEYQGLSGLIEFDLSGQTPNANARWWRVSAGGFEDILRESGCSPTL
jgi:ABC-type branched-subunit amino acid transport system substrate-binding protein